MKKSEMEPQVQDVKNCPHIEAEQIQEHEWCSSFWLLTVSDYTKAMSTTAYMCSA